MNPTHARVLGDEAINGLLGHEVCLTRASAALAAAPVSRVPCGLLLKSV
jgi:cyanophycinase-like exopeptidase